MYMYSRHTDTEGSASESESWSGRQKTKRNATQRNGDLQIDYVSCTRELFAVLYCSVKKSSQKSLFGWYWYWYWYCSVWISQIQITNHITSHKIRAHRITSRVIGADRWCDAPLTEWRICSSRTSGRSSGSSWASRADRRPSRAAGRCSGAAWPASETAVRRAD